MRRLLLVVSATVLFVGCGSTVPLDDVPVEDKAGTALSAQGAGAGAGGSGRGVDNDGVTSVDVAKSADQPAVSAQPRLVYFDYDSFVIKPEFQAVIETHARFITADKTRKVFIEGHTDQSGGREYNLALGQKRAEAVRSAMGLLGVSDSQIEAVSFGKEKPAVQGLDEAAMARNRRAEISYR